MESVCPSIVILQFGNSAKELPDGKPLPVEIQTTVDNYKTLINFGRNFTHDMNYDRYKEKYEEALKRMRGSEEILAGYIEKNPDDSKAKVLKKMLDPMFKAWK